MVKDPPKNILVKLDENDQKNFKIVSERTGIRNSPDLLRFLLSEAATKAEGAA